MANKANPARLGAFILGALALVVLAVVVMGSGQLFQKKHEYILYFQGSVNGLRVGAPVKFKGVQIGSVTRILLNINLGQESTAESAAIKIPVIIELEQSLLMRRGVSQVNLDDPGIMRAFIDSGLRAQLAMESFVTGVLYIDLDLHPETPVTLVLPPGTVAPYQEIPTVPTPLEQVQSAANRVLAQLDQVDFQKLSVKIQATLESVSELATSPELKSAVKGLSQTEASLNQAAVGIRQATLKFDQEVGPLSASLRSTTKNANVALAQARATLATVQDSLGAASPLVYQTGKAMQDLDDAARSVRQLAQYLQRNPSAPVRGRYFSKVAR
jgi:paraquat-inducible protein B